MNITVIYESLYGNTKAIAEAIAAGLQDGGNVTLCSTLEEIDISAADLVVIGGPTHAHGMSRASSRQVDDKRAKPLPGTDTGLGIREVIDTFAPGEGRSVATFDTRFDKPAWLTGSAAAVAGKKLKKRGYRMIANPESFMIDGGEGPLATGELDRARMWGKELTELMGTT
jgi:menaquinone-dependent protoporphyrinogen IX oxidase